MLCRILLLMSAPTAAVVERPPSEAGNSFYAPNRAPLKRTPLIKLPITSFRPGGWVRRHLELQRDGLAGHLGEISVWLTKKDNAWLSKEGKGKYGWEEVPYWLRGYARIAFLLDDHGMIDETKLWVEAALSSQREDGDFGPVHYHRDGMRDLWGQMLMLQVLQSYYEKTSDQRVLALMTRYFRWQAQIPDEKLLKDYWENSRGGDNIASVYWLYNRTGEKALLGLAAKLDKNTADWRTPGRLPNFHNVNVAQGFREPAIVWQQSQKPEDLEASYRDFRFIREQYGQVPGGMFGADENARKGYDDPRQATETCGFVEQLGSNLQMTAITGDPFWTANSEDVAFNSLPAAFMPDYRALRYLTAPNHVVSDAKNHSPGIANEGPFLLMNPFSSRCCQHNHTSGWVNYLEGTWMATQDDGLACLSYTEGEVMARAGGQMVTIKTATRYPFDGKVTLTIDCSEKGEFPLYLLVPHWASGATIKSPDGGAPVKPGNYTVVRRSWKKGDKVTINFPFRPKIRQWAKMKNCMSVDLGPLTFSLKVPETYVKVDGLATVLWDSGFQPGVDQKPWPTHEILPAGEWNFGLEAEPSLKVIRKPWPSGNDPFTSGTVPLEIEAWGRQIPEWGVDGTGLASVLPPSPVLVKSPRVRLKLIPMGAARLRISSFPQAAPALQHKA